MPDAETIDAPRRQVAVDYVSCELVLEAARACSSIESALESAEFELVSEETRERVTRQASRIAMFARLVPSILDPRRIVALGDRCAENPDWWRTNRLRFFCPELSNNEIAELLGLSRHQVRNYVKAVGIPDDCYDNIPKP